jgi:hypothetical protein
MPTFQRQQERESDQRAHALDLLSAGPPAVLNFLYIKREILISLYVKECWTKDALGFSRDDDD